MHDARVYVRRVFIVIWVALSLLGALNHTVVTQLLGQRLQLWLPHLQYGYVMFARNPRVVTVFEYSDRRHTRRNLAEMASTVEGYGYARARTAISLARVPRYLGELCRHELRRDPDAGLVFNIATYDVSKDRLHPSKELALKCSGGRLERHALR